MDSSVFTPKQNEIIEKLRTVLESDQQLDAWLSIPNKMFKDKAPIDVLMSGNFDYFDRFFTMVK